MNTFTKILGSLSILIGVWAVFLGIFASIDSGSSLGAVIGGGLFMALGVTTFVLSRN